ncbi:hypothetical protein [Flavihumibacter petaseus]|uniref:Uncharacterized protein n=1 Tax=Flavihumibacter petaseus NBRC 106054 TaxID=1220578 RepID=A0A0E9N6B9_9BACT|nr:hypothetical protein [Flavihumibacter petaseus]GAO44880.1 hypothetical protein FPE01S_04_01230 [Flavihumibacter petaseus NBRC 106054]
MTSKPLTELTESVSVDDAADMTRRFRRDFNHLLLPDFKYKHLVAESESFDRARIEALLAQPGCAGIRLYSAMKENGEVQQIVIGYDTQNRDMLEAGLLMTDSRRCPPDCGPDSRLNS